MARLVAKEARELILKIHPELNIDILPFCSAGDKFQGDLRTLGGKGAFIKDLEGRLLSNEIDLAIHALKDIPGDIPMHEDLSLVTFLPREDERDALLLADQYSVDDIGDGHGMTLATSSPRRQAILKSLYPQAKLIPLRGNVDTRLRKMQGGQFDGMVLSLTGLRRLELEQHVSHVFEPEEMLPAIGQGVLCLQMRKSDVEKCPFLLNLNHAQTHLRVTAEREMLQGLGGNCHSAIAGFANIQDSMLTLEGWVMNPLANEKIVYKNSVKLASGKSQEDLLNMAQDLGREAAQRLVEQGARDMIDALAA